MTARRTAAADAVFVALADPTRREVLRELLDHGPASATDLAPVVGVSRQAVVKHLGVLGDAGLVTSSREGREVRFEARTAPLLDAADWLTSTAAAWDRRVQRLARKLAR